MILLQDSTPAPLLTLRAEGIPVHRIGRTATAEQIGTAIDCGYALSVEQSDWMSWADTYLLDAAIDLEIGAEEVPA